MVMRKFYKLLPALLVLALMITVFAGCQGGATPVEGWLLNDGGTGTEVASELEKGTPGESKWGIWLNNGFGLFHRRLLCICKGKQG